MEYITRHQSKCSIQTSEFFFWVFLGVSWSLKLVVQKSWSQIGLKKIKDVEKTNLCAAPLSVKTFERMCKVNFCSIEADFKAAFLNGQHMWEVFYPSKRLEQWDTLKPTASHLTCRCTATQTQWEVTENKKNTQKHQNTHTQTQAKISDSLCCIYTPVELRWKSRLQAAVRWESKRCARVHFLYLHPLSEAWTWPAGLSEDTWTLIILAVSSTQRVTLMFVKLESAELFTSAVF